ncbi:MAG: IclR family transcriptional regulator [Candidimonas sp.]|nr:MAG: IclR family transcriptional regulator [Candidimonas sp.]
MNTKLVEGYGGVPASPHSSPHPSAGRAQPAQTVGRAALLLRLIASSHARNLRLVDIAAMASLDKSTAQRLLHRLVLERLLARDPVRGYRLGPLLYELGLAALPETNLRELSQSALHELAHATGDMVFLVMRSGFETVCMNRIAGNYPIQTMTRTEGDRHPLGVGAGGLAILASLHDADVELALNAVAPRLPTYQLTTDVLRDAVAATRANGGLAVDEGSAALDVTAIGRTLHDRTRSPVAAVFVASISHRMGKSRQVQICRQLVACVDTIERVMAGGGATV